MAYLLLLYLYFQNRTNEVNSSDIVTDAIFELAFCYKSLITRKADKIMKTKIAGVLLFLTVVVGTVIYEGACAIFINIVILGYVAIVSVGLALIRYRKGNTKIDFFKGLKKYVIISGILAFLTGVINMASHCLDTRTFDSAAIFGGSGVAIVAVFYSLILYSLIDAIVGIDTKSPT